MSSETADWPGMAHGMGPWLELANQKARDVLNGISHCRIDSSRIKTGAKGSRGTVTVGTFLPPDTWTAWPPELKVAVKMREWPCDDAEESTKFFKSFIYELSLMETLSHPNVIRLVGFVEDIQKGQAWVIVPWEANGNVQEFLKSGEWDIPERVSLIKDVVSGLEYLHTREPPICHGDLKSLNILVDSSYRAVISDFGSARTRRRVVTEDPRELALQVPINSPKVELDVTTSNFTLTGPKFSLRWAAPEVLRSDLQDLPSDMWSIGWICWEIVTGRIPFDGLDNEAVIIKHILCGELPAIRDDVQLSHVLQLCGLMSDCWLSDPAARIDVSAFCRKVRFVPSITPSATTPGGEKLRSASLLMGLGRMYGLQNDKRGGAPSHYRSACRVAVRTDNAVAEADAFIGLAEIYNARSWHSDAAEACKKAYGIYSRMGNELGVANTWIGLGDIYNNQSKYSAAETAFRKAHEIHSRVGNDLGATGALKGLGDIYDARSRYSEAEKAFREAHKIFSRIGNDLGATDALIGLGAIYDARSKYSEAETGFREAHKIFSRIGDDLRATNALISPGDIRDACSRYSEAEKAFREAHEILSRIGNDLRATNAPIGQGEVYNARRRYQEAEIAFREELQIHSCISDGLDLGAANALIGLGGVYEAQSKYFEAQQVIMEAYEIHSRIGNDLGAANALIGLGDIYNTLSKHSEAGKAFRKALGIHSRIGNEFGAANALIGLGESYNAQSRYSEAEKTFTAAREIHSRIGNDLGVANTLVGLGESYNARSRYQEAEKSFREAREIHSSVGNHLGTANALMGLGRIYNVQSRYREAEKTFREAHETHSRIGNHLGAANALVGLGESYNAWSRYQEAEKVCKEAHETHSRIGNNLGAANALVGLGESYNAQSRYQEAEKACGEAGEIHSRIGNNLGAAHALVGLGEIYNALSEHSQAEKAFGEALEIHLRIGNDFGAANALIGLGEVYNNLSRHSEAEQTFREARGLHSRIGSQAGLARAGICVGETCNTRLQYSEADDAFKEALGTLSRLEDKISPAGASNSPEEDFNTQSSYSGDEEAKGNYSRIGHNAKLANAPEHIGAPDVLLTPTYHSVVERLPEALPPPCPPPSPPSLNDASNSLHLSSQRTRDDPALSQIASAADIQSNNNREEQALAEELADIAHAPAPATEELVDLLHALGKAAPKAVRNKHKIYSILRVSRDICNRIMEIGDPHERQSDSNSKALLSRMEDYCALLDALEKILLQLAAILPSEIKAFGADSYSSWPQSRSTLDGILSELCRPPFSSISSHAKDIPEDLFFDDCSWLSRLLYSGIHLEISTQFLDAPKTHPVFAVTNGLEYLETQVKCGVPDEPTRELIIDIATFLAQTLARASPEDDDNKSLQENSSLSADADRDWLVQGLANSFLVLQLDSTLQPSTAKELARKWTDVKIGFTLRDPSAPRN